MVSVEFAKTQSSRGHKLVVEHVKEFLRINMSYVCQIVYPLLLFLYRSGPARARIYCRPIKLEAGFSSAQSTLNIALLCNDLLLSR